MDQQPIASITLSKRTAVVFKKLSIKLTSPSKFLSLETSAVNVLKTTIVTNHLSAAATLSAELGNIACLASSITETTAITITNV